MQGLKQQGSGVYGSVGFFRVLGRGCGCGMDLGEWEEFGLLKEALLPADRWFHVKWQPVSPADIGAVGRLGEATDGIVCRPLLHTFLSASTPQAEPPSSLTWSVVASSLVSRLPSCPPPPPCPFSICSQRDSVSTLVRTHPSSA